MTDEELKDLLLDSGLLKQEEIDKAIGETKKLQRPLERVLVDIRLLSPAALYETIGKHIGYKYISLTNIKPEQEVVKVIPEQMARQTQTVPIMIEKNVLHIATTDPTNLYAIDQIQAYTGYPLEIYISSPQEIEEAISKIYAQAAGGESADLMADLSSIQPESSQPSGEGYSVVKLVDLIIAQAVRDRASDIHIEPEQDVTRIRFRIDGILHEIPAPPKQWEPAIISRIKVLASMDIAESRVPQDGHFQAKSNNKIVDFRISTMPTIYGENLVMRLLDTSSVLIGLERLGFGAYGELERYQELISRPYGIILSTGPTGCGKTTTLYSALMRINSVDRNIITIEDPVEYRLGLIRQTQVNPRAGITFVNGLRAILRQDPDVIMVGEIRDLETAVIAVQAALTGHLVFSTLHTNDAPSAVTRMINMGLEPFLISACLSGVMAQRLVRLICSDCKESYKPSNAVLDKWGLRDRGDVTLYRGRGCQVCKGTGYRGRTGLYELMVIDDEMREMIIASASTVALRKKAREKGMRTLREDGIEKAVAGKASIEEVARVCEEQVEIKKVSKEEKVEPFIKPALDIQAKIEKPSVEPKEVKVEASELAEYQQRITSWFSHGK
ncbi:MAG: GspE/PulE family protein [Candidatus Omnitrophota bacterium]